jgi:hypothetical protein
MKTVRDVEMALDKEKAEYEVKLRKKFERVIIVTLQKLTLTELSRGYNTTRKTKTMAQTI